MSSSATSTRIINAAGNRKETHPDSPRYICPVPVWCIVWDKHRMLFDSGICRQSTVAAGAREGWPKVYIGHNTEQCNGTAINDMSLALEVIDRMNTIVKQLWDELDQLNDYELQLVIRLIFKRFGVWTEIIDPLEQMKMAPTRSLVPPPRKPKGRNPGRRHVIARNVANKEQVGGNCNRVESFPVSKPAQDKVSNVSPSPFEKMIQDATAEERRVRSINTESLQVEQQKQKQIEQQMEDDADEYLESLVGDFVDNGILGKAGDKSKAEKPAKLIGKCIPAKFTRMICQQVERNYRIKVYTVNASIKGDVVLAENIYVDGDKVSARDADKIRRFVNRAVKRHTENQSGKQK